MTRSRAGWERRVPGGWLPVDQRAVVDELAGHWSGGMLLRSESGVEVVIQADAMLGIALQMIGTDGVVVHAYRPVERGLVSATLGDRVETLPRAVFFERDFGLSLLANVLSTATADRAVAWIEDDVLFRNYFGAEAER